MAVFPIQNIIDWAKISQYLGQVKLAQNNLLQGGDVDPNYPVLIWMEWQALDFMLNYNPSEANIDHVANYVYSITKYKAQAKAIAAGGAIGGIVIPGTGVAATIVGVQLIFELGSTPSPKTVNGVAVTLPNDTDASITIPISNMVEDSISFTVGGAAIPTDQINNAVYVTVAYSTTQVVITLNGFTFSTGNNYIISGYQYVAL